MSLTPLVYQETNYNSFLKELRIETQNIKRGPLPQNITIPFLRSWGLKLVLLACRKKDENYNSFLKELRIETGVSASITWAFIITIPFLRSWGLKQKFSREKFSHKQDYNSFLKELRIETSLNFMEMQMMIHHYNSFLNELRIETVRV